MKQNDEIENLFESTFEDFSVEPPPSLKIAIDEKIDFKRGFSKLWIYVPLIILLLSFIGFMFVNNPNPVTNPNSTQLNASENSNKNENEEFNSKYQSEKIRSNNNRSENGSSNNMAVNSTGNTVEQSKNGTIHYNTNIKNESNPNTGKYTSSKESNPVNGLKSITKSSTKNKSIKHTNSKNKKTTLKTDPILSATHKEETTSRTFSTSNTNHSGNVNSSENKNLTSLESKKEDPNNLNGKGIDNTDSKDNTDNKKEINTSDSNSSSTNDRDKAIDSVGNKNDVADNDKSNDTLPTSVPLADTLNNMAKTSSTASWLLSARFGSSIASNAITNKEYKISETSTFFINTEASYLFANNFSITSGFQYNKITNGLQYSTTKYYYVETGIDSLTIPNPNDTSGNQGDTTIFFTLYDSTLVDVIYNQTYSQYSISIPIYFGYNYEINDKWFIDINGGIILSYQQAKRISSDPQIPDPTIRSFGLKGCVRPQIRYQFNDKLGVSFSSNFGYDFVPTMKWSDISRTRIYSEFGIGIHYKL